LAHASVSAALRGMPWRFTRLKPTCWMAAATLLSDFNFLMCGTLLLVLA
jgi:hypothetical protein